MTSYDKASQSWFKWIQKLRRAKENKAITKNSAHLHQSTLHKFKSGLAYIAPTPFNPHS